MIISGIEALDMTDEEFYDSVMSEERNMSGKPINTSRYSLKEQLEIFRNSEQDEESKKLLWEDICALA